MHLGNVLISPTQQYNKLCVSGSLIKVRIYKQDSLGIQAIMVCRCNRQFAEVVMQRSKHSLFSLLFYQEIYKMMMPADMLPQNSCCFANASMWLQVFYILRRLCKCPTTQKQRASIHRYICRLAGHHRPVKPSSQVSCLQ